MAALPDREYRRQFYVAVDQRQGLDERQRQYYVPIYDDPEMAPYDLVPKLRDSIDFSAGESVQLLSGFRGCGKTSELLRLLDELEKLNYRTAYMDIGDFFNTRLPMDLERFPIALAAGFAQALSAGQSAIWDRFVDFLRRVDVSVDASVNVGVATVNFGTIVKDDESFAASAHRAYSANRLTLRREFHAFFSEVLAGLDSTQPVVFVVDSIDHFRGVSAQFEAVRSSVEQAFTELAEDLCIPNVHVVYTVPIYLHIPALGTRQDVVNVKVLHRDGEVNEPGVRAMRAVLAKRAPDGDLDRFIGDTGYRLLLASGGLFRDLLRLSTEALIQPGSMPTDARRLGRAEMVVRGDYETTLTKEQLDLLRHVKVEQKLFTTREQGSDGAALVSSGAILRYPNDIQTWYGVHPLLEPLL